MRRLASAAALLCALAVPPLSAQRAQTADVSATLDRVSEAVQTYFARAQSIICDETVRIQEIGADLLSGSSPARIVRNELRVSWQPAEDGETTAPPVVLRSLISVNGRPPRAKDQDKCFDPAASSPELLGELFLPENRAKFQVTGRPPGKVNGKRALVFDMVDLEKGPVFVEADENCAKFGKPGMTRSRVWVDAETYAVMRIEQSLTRPYDVTIPADRKTRRVARDLTVERSDHSITYKLVAFTDPDESILLPATFDTVQVLRNSAGSPRMRITSNFRNFRRFMTGGRIVQ